MIHSKNCIAANAGKSLLPFAFAFWFTTEIFQEINLQSVAGIPIAQLAQGQALVTLALLCVQIVCLQRYTRRELWRIAAVTALLAVSMAASGVRSLFSAWLFIVAAQNADLDKLIRMAYRILLGAMLVIALLCLAGVIPDARVYRGERLRLSLGFVHPNTLGVHLFELSACHCYLRRARLRRRDGVLVLALAAFAYAVPNSQTAAAGILLTFAVVLGVRMGVRLPVWWAAVPTVGLPAVSIALGLADLKRHPALARLDRLLSNRFTGMHAVWQQYGATLLGQKIYVTPPERAQIGLDRHLWLDNAYGHLLLRCGAAVLLLFVAGYLYTICWHGKRGHGVLVCFFLLYALYGVEENHLVMLASNPFLLAMAPALYGQRSADPAAQGRFRLPALAARLRARRWEGRRPRAI